MYVIEVLDIDGFMREKRVGYYIDNYTVQGEVFPAYTKMDDYHAANRIKKYKSEILCKKMVDKLNVNFSTMGYKFQVVAVR